MKTKLIYMLLLALVIALTGCSDNVESVGQDGMGRLKVSLTDAPFPYDLVAEANVTVFKVEIREVRDENEDENDEDENSEDENGGSPFITLMEEEIDVNLLDLTNGVTQQLADLEVPAGSYDLIRVYVKGVNVVLTDGSVHHLKVPSGAQTGIKVFIDPAIAVAGGISADLLLDFDISRSFIAKGNINSPAGIRGFNFKPVIKASNLSTAGTLMGNVSTLENDMDVAIEGAQISVIAADTLNTTAFTDGSGNYTIMGLTAGSYKILAEAEGFIASDSTDVQIEVANKSVLDFVLDAE
ncbi:DUF4382 domain-containing protein [Flagellimonas sp. 2504JD4-2]